MALEEVKKPVANEKAPQRGAFLAKKGASARNFFEHFQPDFAFGNFAERRHRWLVLAFDFRCVPLAQHAGAVSGGQNKLKAVRDFFEAVFNSNAGHEDLQ